MLFRYALLLVAFASLHAQTLPPCSIETVAGGGTSLAGDGGPALEADILSVSDVTIGPDQSIYLSDPSNGVVWRIFPDGRIETIAEPATFVAPGSIAVAPDGAVYVADRDSSSGGARIFRISPDGVVMHFAGNGAEAFSGDGGAATEAGIGVPAGMDAAADGSLYMAVGAHQRVRRVRPDGVIETVAGSGPAHVNDGHYTGDGIPAVQARLDLPVDVAVAPDGSIYIADRRNYRIRRVDSSGTISTVAGAGFRQRSRTGDLAASAPLSDVLDLEFGPEGRLHYMEAPAGVFRINTDGRKEVVGARTGRAMEVAADGSPIIAPSLSGVLLRLTGPSFSNSERIAGAGGGGFYGDGGRAVDAPLVFPNQILVEDSGRLLIRESLDRVRALDPDGTISAAFRPEFFSERIRSGLDGHFYVSDPLWRIKRVDSDGVETVVAGGGRDCHPFNRCGEDEPAVDTQLPFLRDFDVDSKGRVYLIHDFDLFQPRTQLRVVSVDGVLSTPSVEYGGRRSIPREVKVAPDDSVYILARSLGDQLWRWEPDEGSLELVFDSEDTLSRLHHFALGPDGTIFLWQDSRPILWVLNSDGSLNLIAGDGFASERHVGDGGPALEARFGGRSRIAYSPTGDLFILDGSIVRRINDVADCPQIRRPVLARGAFRDGASYSTALAPGQIFSLFGRDVGPDELVTARVEGDRLATELAGVRVFINDVPAPLVFVSSGQLSGIVPYGAPVQSRTNDAGEFVVDGRVSAWVELDGARSSSSSLFFRSSAPGIFTADASGGGQAAALNQDGSLNSAENPAAPGSVVVLFATGEGQTDPPGVDGKLAALPLPRPLLPVRVTANGQDAQLLYAGGAPGFTAGLMQVNIRLPEGLSGVVEVVLHVGDQASRAVTIAVAPQP